MNLQNVLSRNGHTVVLFICLMGLTGFGCDARQAMSESAESTSEESSEPKSDLADGTDSQANETVQGQQQDTESGQQNVKAIESKEELATFGAGCFWCVEAVLERIEGVNDVTSGYMGGSVVNPTYQEVCAGTTGHAEVVQVHFDPTKLSYEKLLDYFWRLHDPTTLNRQGADVGTQYRSAIYFHSDDQQTIAEASKHKWDESGGFADKIVTEITAAGVYYLAEEYHQDYYRRNPDQGYCRVVIRPKLEKFDKLEK